MNATQRSLNEQFASELLARMNKDDAIRVVLLLTRDKQLIEAAASALRDALIARLQDSARDNDLSASNYMFDLTFGAQHVCKSIIFAVEPDSFFSNYLARMLDHMS